MFCVVMRRCLAVVRHSLYIQRNRATYYQQRKGIVPAFVRRFFLRYPHAHLYILFGVLCSALLGPILPSFYYFATFTPEEFERYCVEKKALVRERQKYGKNLWIPFYSTKETPKEMKSDE